VRLSPEIDIIAEVFVVFRTGTVLKYRSRRGTEALPGSKCRANAQEDSPGTWEIRPSPTTTGRGTGRTSLRPEQDACSCTGAKKLRKVPPSRGETKAKREGRSEVVAANSTREAGIAARATPWRKGAAGSRTRWRER
jgi:hypothetical protein